MASEAIASGILFTSVLRQHQFIRKEDPSRVARLRVGEPETSLVPASSYVTWALCGYPYFQHALQGGLFSPETTRWASYQERFLKRQLSLPVSMISQWWVRRSRSAVVPGQRQAHRRIAAQRRPARQFDVHHRGAGPEARRRVGGQHRVIAGRPDRDLLARPRRRQLHLDSGDTDRHRRAFRHLHLAARRHRQGHRAGGLVDHRLSRVVWDEHDAIDALSEAIRVMVDGVTVDGTQMADEREALMWGFVNMLHSQVTRLDRAVDRITPEMRDLETAQDGTEVKAWELQTLTAGSELSAEPGAVAGDPARHRDGWTRRGDRRRGGLGQDHHAEKPDHGRWRGRGPGRLP